MCPVTQEPPSIRIDLTNYKTLLVRSSRSWDLFPDGNVFIDETTGRVELIPNWDTPYLPNGVENMLGRAGITIEAIEAFILNSTGIRMFGGKFKEVKTDRRTFNTIELGEIPLNGTTPLAPSRKGEVDKLQQEK